MLGGGAISWFSRVQKVTAAVSFESEYVALAEVVNELHFLRQVKGFLTPRSTTTLKSGKIVKKLSRWRSPV